MLEPGFPVYPIYGGIWPPVHKTTQVKGASMSELWQIRSSQLSLRVLVQLYIIFVFWNHPTRNVAIWNHPIINVAVFYKLQSYKNETAGILLYLCFVKSSKADINNNLSVDTEQQQIKCLPPRVCCGSNTFQLSSLSFHKSNLVPVVVLDWQT